MYTVYTCMYTTEAHTHAHNIRSHTHTHKHTHICTHTHMHTCAHAHTSPVHIFCTHNTCYRSLLTQLQWNGYRQY